MIVVVTVSERFKKRCGVRGDVAEFDGLLVNGCSKLEVKSRRAGT